ncbi:MAG TPA: endonuclease/exonuclease/phosphatase family protein [Gemmatimonadales bacterium]|nr:endonuclease/exonuclease/phosphatase family protein [Gemmatimonadales bacterium]
MSQSDGFGLTRHEDDGRRRLEEWRCNVGASVALDLTSAPNDKTRPRSLIVLSWNLWIGRGKLGAVVRRIRNGDYADLGADPSLPLVITVQEAYRSDASIPALREGRVGRVLVAGLREQEDIVETARALGLNLRYAPSMRNGPSSSDRGNALLSTLPLQDAHAIELPLVLQRRVAVTASVVLGNTRLRLISAHLDPRGPPGHRWLGAAGRAQQAQHLLDAVQDDTAVLGADLNLGRGRYEPAWRLLEQAGFAFGVPRTIPAWRHTFHALPRLVLDYILVRDRSGVVVAARVHRLDEHPEDRGARVFGSDHHPLLARIDLEPLPEDSR